MKLSSRFVAHAMPASPGRCSSRSSGGYLPIQQLQVLCGCCEGKLAIYPVFDGDDFRNHRQGRQKRMVMLGDEPMDDDLVGKSFIDSLGLVTSGRCYFVQLADCQERSPNTTATAPALGLSGSRVTISLAT
jgi:hypothetical protein